MPVRGEAIGQFLGGSEPNANITQVQSHNGIIVLINIFSSYLYMLLFIYIYIYIYVVCVCTYVYSCVIRGC